jgi:hypothetical protein
MELVEVLLGIVATAMVSIAFTLARLLSETKRDNDKWHAERRD